MKVSYRNENLRSIDHDTEFSPLDLTTKSSIDTSNPRPFRGSTAKNVLSEDEFNTQIRLEAWMCCGSRCVDWLSDGFPDSTTLVVFSDLVPDDDRPSIRPLFSFAKTTTSNRIFLRETTTDEVDSKSVFVNADCIHWLRASGKLFDRLRPIDRSRILRYPDGRFAHPPMRLSDKCRTQRMQTRFPCLSEGIARAEMDSGGQDGDASHRYVGSIHMDGKQVFDEPALTNRLAGTEALATKESEIGIRFKDLLDHVKLPLSGPPTKKTLPFTDWTVDKMTQKPILLGQFGWAEVNSPGTILARIPFPTALAGVTPNKMRVMLEQFHRVSFDPTFTIVFNSTQFHSGSLRVGYIYNTNQNVPDTRLYDQVVTGPCTEIDASQPGTFEVDGNSWWSFPSWNPASLAVNNFSTQGTLVLAVVREVRVPVDATTAIPFTIYLQLNNVRPQVIRPQTPVNPATTKRLQKDEFRRLRMLALGIDPNVARAEGNAMKKVADVVTWPGRTLFKGARNIIAPGMSDQQAEQMAMNMLPPPLNALTGMIGGAGGGGGQDFSGAAVIQDLLGRALTPATSDPGHVPGALLPILQTLKQLKPIYDSIPWTGAMTTSDILLEIPMVPTEFMNVPLGAIGSMCTYWKGDMFVHVKVVKNKYANGRVRVGVFPPPDPSAAFNGAVEWDSITYEVLDISTNTDVTVRVPYIGPQPYKQILPPGSPQAAPTTDSSYSSGIFRIGVLQPMVAMGADQDQVTLLVQPSFAENFTLYEPMNQLSTRNPTMASLDDVLEIVKRRERRRLRIDGMVARGEMMQQQDEPQEATVSAPEEPDTAEGEKDSLPQDSANLEQVASLQDFYSRGYSVLYGHVPAGTAGKLYLYPNPMIGCHVIQNPVETPPTEFIVEHAGTWVYFDFTAPSTVVLESTGFINPIPQGEYGSPSPLLRLSIPGGFASLTGLTVTATTITATFVAYAGFAPGRGRGEWERIDGSPIDYSETTTFQVTTGGVDPQPNQTVERDMMATMLEMYSGWRGGFELDIFTSCSMAQSAYCLINQDRTERVIGDPWTLRKPTWVVGVADSPPPNGEQFNDIVIQPKKNRLINLAQNPTPKFTIGYNSTCPYKVLPADLLSGALEPSVKYALPITTVRIVNLSPQNIFVNIMWKWAPGFDLVGQKGVTNPPSTAARLEYGKSLESAVVQISDNFFISSDAFVAAEEEGISLEEVERMAASRRERQRDDIYDDQRRHMERRISPFVARGEMDAGDEPDVKAGTVRKMVIDDFVLPALRRNPEARFNQPLYEFLRDALPESQFVAHLRDVNEVVSERVMKIVEERLGVSTAERNYRKEWIKFFGDLGFKTGSPIVFQHWSVLEYKFKDPQWWIDYAESQSEVNARENQKKADEVTRWFGDVMATEQGPSEKDYPVRMIADNVDAWRHDVMTKNQLQNVLRHVLRKKEEWNWLSETQNEEAFARGVNRLMIACKLEGEEIARGEMFGIGERVAKEMEPLVEDAVETSRSVRRNVTKMTKAIENETKQCRIDIKKVLDDTSEKTTGAFERLEQRITELVGTPLIDLVMGKNPEPSDKMGEFLTMRLYEIAEVLVCQNMQAVSSLIAHTLIHLGLTYKLAKEVLSRLMNLFRPPEQPTQGVAISEGADEKLGMKALQGFILSILTVLQGTLPTMKQVTACMTAIGGHFRSLANIGAGIEALKKTLIPMAAAVANYVMAWYFGEKDWELKKLMRFDNIFPDLEKWLRHVVMIDEASATLAATRSQDEFDYYATLRSLGASYELELVNNKSEVKLLMEVRLYNLRLSKIVGEAGVARRGYERRYAPFVVGLFGPSGVGKSFLQEKVIDDMGNYLEIPTENRTYTRCQTKYWDGYQNQWACYLDEFAQATDDEQALEFISLVSNADCFIDLARINEKGMKFDSDFMLVSTNAPYPQIKTIRFQPAYLRRRHLMVKMQFCGRHNEDGEKIFKEDWTHARFMLYHSDREEAIDGNWLSYEQLREVIRVRALRHWQGQYRGWANMGTRRVRRYPDPNYLVDMETRMVPPEAYRAMERIPQRYDRKVAPNGPLERKGLWANLSRIAVGEMDGLSKDTEPVRTIRLCGEEHKVTQECALCKELAVALVDRIQPKGGVLEARILTVSEQVDRQMEQVRVNGVVFPRSVCKDLLEAGPDGPMDEMAQIYWPEFQKLTPEQMAELHEYVPTKREFPRIFYEAREKTSQKTWERIKEHILKNKKSLLLLGVCVAAGVLYTFSHVSPFMVKEQVAVAESLTRDQASQQRRSKYQVKKVPAKETVARAEAVTDQNALEMAKSGLENVYKIKNLTQGHGMHVVFIRDTTFVVPAHFARVAKQDDVILLTGKNGLRWSFSWDVDRLYMDKRPVVDNLYEDKALYVADGNVRAHKNITHHFITEKSVKKGFEGRSGFLHLRDAEGIPTRVFLNDVSVYGMGKQFCSKYTDPMGVDRKINTVMLEGISYAAESDVGWCGAPVYVNSVDFPQKLCGIHLGSCTDRAYAIFITQEWIDSMTVGVAQCAFEIPIPNEVRETDARLMVEVPEHSTMELLGQAGPEWQVRFATKTEIQKSPIHGVYPPTTAPSVLTPADPRFQKDGNPTPTQRIVDGFAKRIQPMKASNVKRAVEVIHWKLAYATRKWKNRHILSIDDAVNGRPDLSEMAKGMEMDTSPGLPWVRKRPPGRTGKKFMFEETLGERGENYYLAKPELVHAIKHREEEARAGRRVVSVWYSMLKDERLPKAKITTGNTRSFCVGPLDFNILFRQYFGQFIWAMRHNNRDLASKVGINPHGRDWTDMWRQHKRVGNRTFAGDYSKFDRTVTGELVRQFAVLANKWYDDGNDVVRNVLIDELYHRVDVIGNAMVLMGQGVPSGVSATSDIDGVVNEIYLLSGTMDLLEMEDREERWSLPETTSNWKEREILDLAIALEMMEYAMYGDDIVVSTSEELSKTLNFETYQYILSTYDIPFTSEEKGADIPPRRELEDVSFLKRKWVREAGSGVFKAPLDINVIREEVNWVRKSEDRKDMCRVVVDASLRECMHQGKQVFEEHKTVLNRSLAEHGIRPVLLEYEELDRAWQRGFDLFSFN